MSNDYNQEEGQIIEDHEYDGIKELNNPLPSWWLTIFYVTIVFSFFYFFYYEVFNGPSHEEELQAAMDHYASVKQEKMEELSNVEVDIQAILQDEAKLNEGKVTYIQTCAACHGEQGQGGIGPNLTDKYWIHSKGDYDGVMIALKQGFPAKGMPPWKDVIPIEKHALVVAYVLSLQGSTPENAKEPQGELNE